MKQYYFLTYLIAGNQPGGGNQPDAYANRVVSIDDASVGLQYDDIAYWVEGIGEEHGSSIIILNLIPLTGDPTSY